jgi:hypothetical protein
MQYLLCTDSLHKWTQFVDIALGIPIYIYGNEGANRPDPPDKADKEKHTSVIC